MTNGDLGANEWLVDEMFEAYQKDPNSVDKAWVEYFLSKQMISNAVAGVSQQVTNNVNGSVGNPIAGAPNGGVPPTPKAATKTAPVAPVATSAPAQAPQSVAQQITQQDVLKERGKVTPTPADPQVKPAPVVAAPSSARVEPLRGVAGRVVQ